MHHRSLVALSSISALLVAGFAVAAPPGIARTTTTPAAGGRRVANAKAFGKAQFEALHDDDIVEVAGKPMTKRDVLARIKSIPGAPAAADKDDGDISKKVRAKAEAENAPVVAKFAELKIAPVSAAGALKPTAPAAAPSNPQISGMLGALKPGAAVIVFGSGFGTAEGEVRMFGNFPNNYVKLSVDSWGAKGVGVFVPQLTGAVDQQVTLKVVSKDGHISNPKTAQFTAGREVRKVKLGEFATKQCANGTMTADTCETAGQKDCKSSVCGKHSSVALGSQSYGNSTDRFALNLKNGWEYESHDFTGEAVFDPPPQDWANPVVVLEMYLLGNDKPTLKATTSSPSSPSFEVTWATPSFWSDRYRLNVYISGPTGTSPF